MRRDEQGEKRRSGDGPDRGAPEMLLLFRVGELSLGIDVRRVREVTRALPISVPLPGGGAVAGMTTLRGESVAVVDLDRLLGTSPEGRDERARMIALHHQGPPVCLLVDRIDGLLDMAEVDLEPLPPVVAAPNVSWLSGVARPPAGDLIGVVDPDRILSRVAFAEAEGEPTRV